MQTDASQLKVRLEILPEVQDLENRALVNEIGREIFYDLKSQKYHIEPIHTGEMGGGNIFLIWLSEFVNTAGPTLITAAVAEVAIKSMDKIMDKTADECKKIFQKIKTSKHKKLPATIETKLPNSNEINAQGSLGEVLEMLPTLLKEQAELSDDSQKSKPDNGSQQITDITIIKITIKVSRP